MNPFILCLIAVLLMPALVTAQEQVKRQVRFPVADVDAHIAPKLVMNASAERITSFLRSSKVQKELQLEEQQTTRIETGFAELKQWRKKHRVSDGYKQKISQLAGEFKAILTNQQRSRLDQIILQSRGILVLGDQKIADKLKMAEEQRLQFIQIQRESQLKQAQLLDERRGGFNGLLLERKLTELAAQTEAELLDILIREQQVAFALMKGEEFVGPFEVEGPFADPFADPFVDPFADPFADLFADPFAVEADPFADRDPFGF